MRITGVSGLFNQRARFSDAAVQISGWQVDVLLAMTSSQWLGSVEVDYFFLARIELGGVRCDRRRICEKVLPAGTLHWADG